MRLSASDGFDHLVTADVRNLADNGFNALAVGNNGDEFRANADFSAAATSAGRTFKAYLFTAEEGGAAAHSQGRTFMPGEPMKWPTKVCAGRSNRSTGVPICTISPSCITTTCRRRSAPRSGRG
jgi:hypothetical protein